MPDSTTQSRPLPVEALTQEAFAPYGAMLGRPYGADEPAFTNPMTDFWHQHAFNAGAGGQPEVLWVNYRRNDGLVAALEAHWLTQQVIVPLGSEGVIHIVALTDESGARPDLQTVKAFKVPPGQGICMQPGTWHATQVAEGEVACLMLTRASTTVELASHMQHNTPARETSIVSLDTAYQLSRA